MSFNNAASVKSGMRDPQGRPLVFAPPIFTGFRGSPLALSAGRKMSKAKAASRRKWAKRRAYEA